MKKERKEKKTNICFLFLLQVESVLGTTGGLLGLFIGFSLITVVESFILLYDVISLICKRMLFK